MRTLRNIFANYYIYLFVYCSVTIAPCRAIASIRFEMQNMGKFNSGVACSVNRDGDVAGIGHDDKGQLRYVVWEKRQNKLVWGPYAKSVESIAKINDDKYVLGETPQNDSNLTKAFIWNTTKNTLNYSPDSMDFEPKGFNNYNIVVGSIRYKGIWDPAKPDKYVKAVIWNPADNSIKIIEKFVQLSAINDYGCMAGSCYLKEDIYIVARISDSNTNGIKYLDVPKDIWSIAYDISNYEQTVGYTINKAWRDQAYLWNGGNRKIIYLGKIGDIFSLIYGSRTKAYAINNNEQVVGWSSKGVVGPLPLSFYDDGRAFYWDKMKGMCDLNRITINLPKDCQLIEAKDISDSGMIVGWAIGSKCDRIPFLLQPVKD